MRIFTPIVAGDYELCHPIDDGNFETINVLINGTSRRDTWKPIAMHLVHEDEGKPLEYSDSPWLGTHALIFRPKALDGLVGELLRSHGELLPLLCPGADLWIYNPTRVIDALNENASSVNRFDSGRIMWIQRHVFDAESISNVDIFKIPNWRVSPTYVSQRFVDAWTSAGLTGLAFEEIWSPN